MEENKKHRHYWQENLRQRGYGENLAVDVVKLTWVLK
jgi:hypothetical protein